MFTSVRARLQLLIVWNATPIACVMIQKLELGLRNCEAVPRALAEYANMCARLSQLLMVRSALSAAHGMMHVPPCINCHKQNSFHPSQRFTPAEVEALKKAAETVMQEEGRLVWGKLSNFSVMVQSCTKGKKSIDYASLKCRAHEGKVPWLASSKGCHRSFTMRMDMFVKLEGCSLLHKLS
eukprot:scaffold133026_cov15-Tisochrysis_lutea.AAC.1